MLRAVDPYRVASDLKLPLENKDGLLFTKDPQDPQYDFQISRREFIAANYGNPIPGCNIFDFLKLHMGSYERAADHVLDCYHNLIQAPGGLSIDSVRVPLIDSLTEARQQFEEILALRNALRRHENLGGVYLYCRGKGISPDHAWMMFYVAHGRKLNTLLQYCSDARACVELVNPYAVIRGSPHHVLEARRYVALAANEIEPRL